MPGIRGYNHRRRLRCGSGDRRSADPTQSRATTARSASLEEHRRPGPDRPLATATAAHRELFFPIEPEQLLVVDHISFPLEQNVQPPIAEAAALLRDRPQALTNADIVLPGGLISHG